MGGPLVESETLSPPAMEESTGAADLIGMLESEDDEERARALLELRVIARTLKGQEEIVESPGSEKILDLLLDPDLSVQALLVIVNLSSTKAPQGSKVMSFLWRKVVIQRLSWVMQVSHKKAQTAASWALANLATMNSQFLVSHTR
eukprot:m.684 g.684  ORF g.684 m.684 type:complete len:146 (+) comp309_c0_seq1:178-615(+)